jgi:hypothetical protein
MTRWEKSDSQLNAEAGISAKRKPIAARIRGHRLAYHFDCVVPRLTARQPPTLFDYDTLDWHTEDGAATGMPMSGPMLRRLSESPGPRFPWASAFAWLRQECRRYHFDHRGAERPYWRGRLCWEAVRLVVIGGEKGRPFVGPLSVEETGRILRLDRIEELLHRAFDDMEKHAVWLEMRAEKRAREDEGRFTIYDEPPRHHIPSEQHIAECPNPVCRARRQAA